MHPEDRDLQRILWRISPNELIQEYQLNTVTYDTSSAPFLATRCLNKLMDDNQDQHQQAAHAIHGFYVDDLLSGSNTIEEAIQLRNGITTLLQTAGLTLRKWASNSQQFLDDIPEYSRESQQRLSLDRKDGVSTLGLHWLPHFNH
jgi:DNA mismatch repair ATPase MutS